MAHHKRRKRKRAGIKGHCGMCQMQSEKGTGAQRRPNPQERRAAIREAEQVAEPRPLIHPAEFRLWDEFVHLSVEGKAIRLLDLNGLLYESIVCDQRFATLGDIGFPTK